MTYNDIDDRKTAFVFELDDVLYPEKDYLFQVYYLFASFMEYTELLDANILVKLMVETYQKDGPTAVFHVIQKKFKIDEKYRTNLDRLMLTAKLPLKLLLYQNMLSLLQSIIIDRKKVFIVTNGHPEQQLNKIKYTEWNGLEKYFTCYFTAETMPMPEPDALHLLMTEHQLQRRNIVMIGASDAAKGAAESCGIDFIFASDFL